MDDFFEAYTKVRKKNYNNPRIRDHYLLQTLLLVLFVGLKLTDNIAWSWLWVLSPIWIVTIIHGIVMFRYYCIWKIYGWL